MPNSQTRKRSSARSPRALNDLHWLANPYEQLRRSTSFAEGGVSDAEFFAFFEQIGEVAAPGPANRSPRSNRNRTHRSPARRSPRAAGAGEPPRKSPKAAAKSPKAAAKSPKAAGKP
jgi:hypothetical protein